MTSDSNIAGLGQSTPVATDDATVEATITPPLPHWVPPPPTTADLEWADILTVDLSDSDRGKLIKTVSTALERDGFFYVIGHGIPIEKLQRQFDLGQLAFDGVDREEKERHRAPIKEKGSFIGYKVSCLHSGLLGIVLIISYV
jgi:hypothetical protein